MYYDDGLIYASLSIKQANVIYRNAKLGNIKVLKFQMEQIYDFINNSHSIYFRNDLEFTEMKLFEVVDLLFKNEFAKAQEIIDFIYPTKNYSSSYLNQYGRLNLI